VLTSKKSRILAASIAAAIAVSAAGVGAVTTLTTVIANNHVEAQKGNDDDNKTGGALLKLTGDPINYTFDGTKVQDSVVGNWTLKDIGDKDSVFKSAFSTKDFSNKDLEGLLRLDYGTVKDGEITWHSGGTVAAPKSFEDATGGKGTIKAGETIRIPVRLTLDDPTKVPGKQGEKVSVDADFTVSYAGKDDSKTPDQK